MKGATKRKKIPGFMRVIVAANVKAAMEHKFSEHSNKPKRLAEAAGVSLSTVQRIVGGTNGASIDHIESVADALDLSAYQLLVPNLDPANPPVIPGVTRAEQQLYARWRKDRFGNPTPLELD